MNKIEIFIEDKPQYAEANLFVYERIGNGIINEYTLKDNLIISERIETNGVYQEPKPFIKAPSEFIHMIATALAAYIESKGGINSEQRYKGKIDSMTDEVKWLRSCIERQLTPISNNDK